MAVSFVTVSGTAPNTGVLIGGIETAVTTSYKHTKAETGRVSSSSDTGIASPVVHSHGL